MLRALHGWPVALRRWRARLYRSPVDGVQTPPLVHVIHMLTHFLNTTRSQNQSMKTTQRSVVSTPNTPPVVTDTTNGSIGRWKVFDLFLLYCTSSPVQASSVFHHAAHPTFFSVRPCISQHALHRVNTGKR